MFPLGPVGGFLIAALATSLPENLKREYYSTQFIHIVIDKRIRHGIVHHYARILLILLDMICAIVF